MGSNFCVMHYSSFFEYFIVDLQSNYYKYIGILSLIKDQRRNKRIAKHLGDHVYLRI